jgi:hypothetical protein
MVVAVLATWCPNQDAPPAALSHCFLHELDAPIWKVHDSAWWWAGKEAAFIKDG